MSLIPLFSDSLVALFTAIVKLHENQFPRCKPSSAYLHFTVTTFCKYKGLVFSFIL